MTSTTIHEGHSPSSSSSCTQLLLLEHLPFALLSSIVGYLDDDPRSICSLEATCQLLQHIVTESKSWQRLYQERWISPYTNISGATTSSSNDKAKQKKPLSSAASGSRLQQQEQVLLLQLMPTGYWKSEYQRRHTVDQQVQTCIDQLLDEDTDRSQVVTAVENIMSFQKDAMHTCWNTWLLHNKKENNMATTTSTEDIAEGNADTSAGIRDGHEGHNENNDNDNNNENNDSNSNMNLTDRKAIISFCLLRSVHCSVVFQDIQQLCSRELIQDHIRNNNDAKDVDDDMDSEEEEEHEDLLEEYCIASSRMFFDISKQGPADTTAAWIRQELDDIATLVQERIDTTMPSSFLAPMKNNTNNKNSGKHKSRHNRVPKTEDNENNLQVLKHKLNVLNTVLFEELDFKGNTTNYYDFDNSMLHKALQRRTGIPMTLAVLYKLIARRIGIHADIIGLPGHIVIGIPSLEKNPYIDVFCQDTEKRFLSLAGCQRIVHSYGHVMMPEFAQPLTPQQVFRRILNNCANCLSQSFPPNASKRMAVEAIRAVLINPTNDQVEACQRWFCQILWGSHSTAILREMCLW